MKYDKEELFEYIQQSHFFTKGVQDADEFRLMIMDKMTPYLSKLIEDGKIYDFQIFFPDTNRNNEEFCFTIRIIEEKDKAPRVFFSSVKRNWNTEND